jgi:hypothetical protein
VSLMTLLGGSCELRAQQGVGLGRGIYASTGTPEVFTGEAALPFRVRRPALPKLGSAAKRKLGWLLAGAPVIVAEVPVDGYAAYLGISTAAGLYNYDCQGTYKRGTCLIVGTVQVMPA